MTTTFNSTSRYQTGDRSRRIQGIVVVVAVHALLLWLVLSGVGRKAVALIKKPIEAVVIQEVIIPPPPPPPPPPKTIKAPDTPPRAEIPYVPPPEVAPPVNNNAPVVRAVTAVPNEPAIIAPAPVVAAPVTKPSRADIGVACPTQVAPEIPNKALEDGISGVVRAQARIVGGVVKEVTILSGPGIFHAAVKRAMLRYKCVNDGGEDVLATQEFNFKVE